MRIGFTGASGTGKSTLAKHLVDRYGLEMNPVGSRSVAAAMGFASPYDVDAAGRRAEFQHRLMTEKRAWENERDAFVTDRTTLDNLAYTAMHDVAAIDAWLLDQAIAGMQRYAHVFYCPVGAVCNPGNDPARKHDLTYHRVFDVVLAGMLARYVPQLRLTMLTATSADERIREIDRVFAILRPT